MQKIKHTHARGIFAKCHTEMISPFCKLQSLALFPDVAHADAYVHRHAKGGQTLLFSCVYLCLTKSLFKRYASQQQSQNWMSQVEGQVTSFTLQFVKVYITNVSLTCIMD